MDTVVNQLDKEHFNIEAAQEVAAKENPKAKESKPVAKIQCTECAKSYSSVTNLQEHFQNVHEKKTRFNCNFCDFKRMAYQCRFIDHVKSHFYPVVDFAICLTCQLCSMDFESSTKLARHYMQKHRAFRKFECDYCGHRTNRKNELNIHITRKHLLKSLENKYNKERPFKCTFKDCAMRFKDQLALKQHMKVH